MEDQSTLIKRREGTLNFVFNSVLLSSEVFPISLTPSSGLEALYLKPKKQRKGQRDDDGQSSYLREMKKDQLE